MIETTPRVPSSERAFEELKGDFTESVKVTVDTERVNSLNGWYVYERAPDGENRFIKKDRGTDLIYILLCQTTANMEFDRNLGVLLSNYVYDPVGPLRGKEYATLRERLIAVQEWR